MSFDLRSDFLSPPTPQMVAAMVEAAREPAGFELRENGQQRTLETYAAKLLGKDDALLFPTCTMANLAAVMAQIRPGEVVVGDAASHCVLSEAGGIAALAGGMVVGLRGQDGRLPIDELSAVLGVTADPQRQPARLVLLETTHNRAGGVALPLDHIEEVGALARDAGAGLHMDGARFFNAAVALDVTPAKMAAPATTVSLSLNKALGAPNGALLVGPRDIIARALVLRQQLGGGLRPSGAIAAAGLVALETMLPQLQRDHEVARELAAALRRLGFSVGPNVRGTNIVLVELAPTSDVAAFLGRLVGHGVRAIAFGPGRVRLCVHRGIGAEDIPAIAAAFAATQES